jgi:nucleoside-diphosphate-sugar epimerase
MPETIIKERLWDGRACLVTGGGGFGGSHLCQQLINRGARVYVLDRYFQNNSYLVLSGTAQHVQLIPGDIRDLDLVTSMLTRFPIDTIFHLAAQPIVPTSNRLPFETLSVNAVGTYVLLEAARRVETVKQFIFASSGAYYGTTSSPEAIAEDAAPALASNIYSPSKVAGDIAVRSYAKTFGLNGSACRFMNTYGPGDTNFSRIVPRAIHNLISRVPYAFGDRDDGTTTLDYMNIRDMAKAYICVAEHSGSVLGEAFNFSGGNLIRTDELTRLVSRLFDGGEREPVFSGPRNHNPTIKHLDTSKARRVLGWQPEVTLEEGLKETIDWYRRFWNKI